MAPLILHIEKEREHNDYQRAGYADYHYQATVNHINYLGGCLFLGGSLVTGTMEVYQVGLSHSRMLGGPGNLWMYH